MVELPVAWIVVALVLVLALVVAWWRASTRIARGNRRRQRRGAQGEHEAESLLTARGYEIVERQAYRTWELSVDGQSVEAACRADFLVRRGGRLWVADAKTGALVTNPRHPATRRQLLEYAHCFGVDGVLLVNTDRGEVHHIRFPRGWIL